MTFKRISTGKKGEELAASFLRSKGYKIIENNFRTRHGEIDIIADDGCVSFIEVRSLNSKGFGLPEHSVNRRKQDQIAKAALMYIKIKKLEDRDCRFDVVSIEDVDSDSPKIRLIKNAFELNERYRY